LFHVTVPFINRNSRLIIINV